MMQKFSCSNCSTEIMAEESFQGQLVECPVCSEIQIVPENPLTTGDKFDNFEIIELTDSNIIWNSYVAKGSPVSDFPDQSVTLKVPTMFLRQNLDDFDSFINVVCRNASLNANEFPQLIERGGDSTNPFFIYKYENTLNLYEFAQLHSPMEPFEALRVIRMIAYAMNGVWNKDKIVHQNLNPQNIRLTAKHGLRINEVGISQFVISNPTLIEKGLDIWNIRYMSPEFINDGEAHTPAEDIYALGGVFYLLLTGNEPYFDVQDMAMISQLETPNPLKINQDISQPVYKIFCSMMEKNKQLRIKSWIKLIEEIDSVLDKSTQRISLKQYKSFEQEKKKVTKKPEKKGHNMQSTATWVKMKDVKRDQTLPLKSRKKKKKDITSTQARLVKDDELSIESIQRKRLKRSKTTSIRMPIEDNTPFMQKMVNLCKENIILLLFAFVGLSIAGGLIAYSFHKDSVKKQKRAEHQAKIKAAKEAKERKKAEALAAKKKKKLELAKRKKAELLKNGPKIDKDSLEGQILLVEEFYKENPKKFKETIRKYEKLIDHALTEKKFAIMDDLKERIINIEKVRDKLVAEVLKTIKKKCDALWKEQKYDEIAEYLTNYDGKYADLTKMKRKIYLRHYEEKKDRIEQAEKEREEKKFAEIEYISETLKNVPLQLLSNNYETAVKTIEEAIAENKYETLIPFLKKSLKEIKTLEGLPELFKKKYFKYIDKKKKFKIRNKTVALYIESIKNGNIYYRKRGNKIGYVSCMELPSEQLLELLRKSKREEMEKSPLFKGLLYANQFDTEKAKEEFNKLPYDLNLIFNDALDVINQELALKATLKEFNINYDPRNQMALLEDINDIKISESDAKDLFSEIEKLLEKNKDSKFLKKNETLIKTLVNFCNKNSEAKKQLASSIVISKGNDDEESASDAKAKKPVKASKELSEALVKALEGFGSKKTIKLEPGVYKLPDELFDFSDVTLIGQKGVVFKGRVNFYGDNISISDIVFNDSPFYIGANTRKVKIENCMFNDEMVRVGEAKKVSFKNCFFRGLSLREAEGTKLDHCTIISPKQGSEKQGALWLNSPDVNVENSIIYGERFGVIFTDLGKRKNKIFNNCVWYGKKGLSVMIDPKDRDNELITKTIVTKPLRLRKYCRARNNYFDIPQFIDPASGNWNIIKGSPGYDGGDDGKNCGLILP